MTKKNHRNAFGEGRSVKVADHTDQTVYLDGQEVGFEQLEVPAADFAV